MLTVTDLNGNSEMLTNITNVEVTEVINKDMSIVLTAFATDEHAYPLIQEESIVELDGQEFRVKKLDELKHSKEIQGTHVFFDLIDHYIYNYIGGSKSIDDVFSYLLNGTGWTFQNVDVTNQELLANFGEDNALSLIHSACSIFGCELKIEPGKHIKLYKEIGEDNDVQFRYGYNVKTLNRNIDTSKLSTVIKGFGGQGLVVEYRSPNEAIYGEKHATPIRDERITTTETMIKRLQQEIKDIPEISIQLDVNVIGSDVGLGDKIWLIYEPVNLDFQTRIIERKWFPFSKRSPVVTLANAKKTFTNVLTETRVEIKQNQKETRSRINQTNEKITLEVERIDESISLIEQDADSIKLSVEAVESSVAEIDLKADNINLSVQELDTRLSNSVAEVDVKADNISLSVSNLNDRVGSAESSISVQAGQISSKVSSTDYNGSTIASLINQTASTVKIDAKNIQLNGITEVANTLSIGSPGSTGIKILRFRTDTYIETSGDGLAFDSAGTIVFRTPVQFNSNVSGVTARFG